MRKPLCDIRTDYKRTANSENRGRWNLRVLDALGDIGGGASQGRRLLLDKPWSAWRDGTLAELSVAHPDLAGKTTRIDLTRYGHAMAIPVPGNRLAPRPPVGLHDRLTFAHSDWAGYSVLEEAFTLGHRAGLARAS